MKGHFHLFALSAAFSVIASNTGNFSLFLGAWFLWLVYLYFSKRINFVLFVSAFFSFFFFHHYFPAYDPAAVPTPFPENKTHTFTGTIVSDIERSEEKLSFTFLENQTETKLNVVLFDDDERNKRFPYTYHAVCSIKGKFLTPPEATNPFQFDMRRYWFEQGIAGQIIVESAEDIVCTNHNHVLSAIYTFRKNMLQKAKETLHPELSGWQQALIFGDKSGIDEGTEMLFQRWGLSHLLAISGLHVGIILTIVYFFIIRIFQWTKEKARLFVLMFLPVYALLAGGQPSVWRASLMAVVVLFMQWKKWKLSHVDMLSIVFLTLIIGDRHMIFHAGFQFSFLVTLGLILSHEWFKQAENRFDLGLKISFIAQMMIVPLQMHYFFYFQPLAILLNVFVVPYFSLFVIPFCFVSLTFSYLPKYMVTFLETFFLKLNQFIIDFIKAIDKTVNVPFVSGEISLFTACCYYFFLVMMMIALNKKRHRNALLYGLMLTATLTFIIVKPYISSEGLVTMLDIGQGDAFVIELPYRKGVFLIDGGATFDYQTFEPKDNVFQHIIRPYLMGRGIETIDAIFVTHADLDHHGSIRYILEHFDVKEVIVHPYFNLEDKEFKTWKQLGAKITKANVFDEITRNGHSFYVLGPLDDKRDENDNSLVLYTEIGKAHWLFTGDIGKEVEREIASLFHFLDVDIVKVAHHGSDTSTDEQFLKTFRPKYGWISVGRNNRYGHPKEEVLETLETYGVTIYRTDEQGAVQFIFDDEKAYIKPFLNQ